MKLGKPILPGPESTIYRTRGDDDHYTTDAVHYTTGMVDLFRWLGRWKPVVTYTI